MKNEARKYLVVVVLAAILGILMPAGVWAEEDKGVSEIASQQVNTGISNETQMIINESAQEMIDSAGTIAIEATEEVISTGQQQDNNTINTSMNTSEFEQKLQQFQAKYGYYNGSYYRDSDFPTAWQCHGYASLLSQEIFGVAWRDYGARPAGWTSHTDINQVQPGDFIRCFNNGHSVFVLGVSGDTVTFTDANYWAANYGANYIRWGVQKPKSYFTGITYIAHYSANPVVATPADTTPPTITNVRITDVNAEGFTVRCNMSDNVGVTEVRFPTWTNVNGQDDLIWHVNWINGNEAAYRVLYSDHKNERGDYTVHIYAFDAAGNIAIAETGIGIDAILPVISNVEIVDKDATGYTVKLKATDESGIARVQFPTWTTAGPGDGRDDLVNDWPSNPAVSGTINGDIITFRVNDADHNCEKGEYNTHVYAYDNFGNAMGYAIPPIILSDSGELVVEKTLNGHTYELFDDAMTWSQAKTKAEELGGHLVTINSADEQALMETMLPSGKRGAYFIGGTDEGHEGTFTWITGEYFGLAKWEKGQPDNFNGSENWLEILKDTCWNDQSATAKRGFIVEKASASLTTTLSRTDGIISPTVNSSLLFKGETTGGTAPYQYKFTARLGETTTTIQDYSETATAIFKPLVAGDYTLTVQVKDASGNTGTQSMVVTISEATVLESKFVAFLVKDPSGNFYEYDAESLNKAYLAYQINPTLASAKMYQQFSNSQCSVIALKDQAKGYMDYSATANACLKAQMQGGSFDVNAYFAGSEAKVYAGNIGTVKTVDKDGNVL